MEDSQLQILLKENISKIYDILDNAGVFKDKYNELINDIVEPLNRVCSEYVEKSIVAVKCDVYEDIIKSTNFPELNTKLTKDVRAKRKPKASRMKFVRIPDIPEYEIETYDTDPLVSMFVNWTNRSVKKYTRYRKIALGNLDTLSESVEEFETIMLDYKRLLMENMKRYVQGLYEVHYKYVLELMESNGKNKGEQSIIINDKNIKLINSQSTFIKESLKSFLDLQ